MIREYDRGESEKERREELQTHQNDKNRAVNNDIEGGGRHNSNEERGGKGRLPHASVLSNRKIANLEHTS